MPSRSPVKRARPRACRSKYLGATIRVRGRDATVVGCARPRKRPAPKAPVPRLRVTYAKSGRTRPVPRSAVYRAARRAAKPSARGCRSFDPERAPWLSRRAPDTSFDFGEDAPAPRVARVARARLPEMQLPARLPSPAMLAVLEPETRELAPWLAYAAPWAWDAVAEAIARARGLDARSARVLSPDEMGARYGYDYGRGFGSRPAPRGPTLARLDGSSVAADPPFRPRPSALGFVADAKTVARAIVFFESARWSGALLRVDGVLASAPPPDPARTYIPPGTHPSTAAATRRRVAEENDRVANHLRATERLMGEAREIVAGWASGAKAIPSGLKALASESAHEVEYQETWSHGGEDWRLFIDREGATVRVEWWTGAGWRFAWGTAFDLRRGVIPLDDAPEDVGAAVKALVSTHGWRIAHLFGGGLAGRRRTSLDRYDRGTAPVDPFADSCAPRSPAAREAWQLTRRLPCATPKAREALAAVRNRELAALCEDPDSDGCDAFYELVDSGCEPACEPGKGHDEGNCPKQITAAQIEAWSRGEEPAPDHVFDSDKPHLIGASDNCYYSPSMRARMALHERVVAETAIPDNVARRGASAVQEFLKDAIRNAEAAHALGEAWQRNDARILGRVKPAHRSTGNPLEDLKHAFAAHVRGDDGPAYSLAKKGYHVLAGDGVVDEGSLIDALLGEWVEGQHSTSEKGREARIAAFRDRVRREGRYAVAASIAGIKTSRAGIGTKARRSAA